MTEMLTYLERVLSPAEQETNQTEQRQLSDLLLKTYIQQILLSNLQNQHLIQKLKYA